MVVLSDDGASQIHQATDDLERSHLLRDLINLPKARIQEFLDQNDLPRSGTKEQLRGRVGEAIESGTISLDLLVAFLDAIVPWGKQHVYLLRGPDQEIARWKDASWVKRHLAAHRLEDRFNHAKRVHLPQEMRISEIEHSSRRLRVTAVHRCVWFERSPALDCLLPKTEQPELQFRAYSERVSRVLICLEWDFVTNSAFLQISQLPPGVDCEGVKESFFRCIEPWLNPCLFSVVDLHPAIRRIQEQEEQGIREARSHGIQYCTARGKRLSGRSGRQSDSLLGDASLNRVFSTIRSMAIGRFGHFYWLPTSVPGGVLERELRVDIEGNVNRIHISTFDREQSVRHVLSRIRQWCSPTC